MTGLIIAAVIIGLIVLVGAATLFMLLPILLAAVGLLALLAVMTVAAVLLLPSFVTLDQFKPQILGMLERATGREIAIGGPIGFSVWPVLGLQLNDISIGNPEGARDPILLAAREIGVGVTLSSLMDHRLELRELRVVGAQINLGVDDTGKGNWLMKPHAVAEKESPAAASPEGGDFAIRDINIHSVSIKDADISYDRAGVTVAEVRDFDLDFSMPGLDGPARLDGQLAYQGRTVTFSGEVGDPRAALEGRSSPVNLALKAGDDKVALAGELGSGKFSGQIDAGVPDMSASAAWATRQPSTSLPVRTLALSSRITADANRADFSGMDVKLDAIRISGTSGVNWSGAKPGLTADVDVSRLDFDSLSVAAPSVTATAPDEAAEPDLSGLRAMNADVTARLAGVVVRRMELGATTAKVTLQGGRLQASLLPASFYGGTVTARADVNAGTRSFSGETTLDGVNIEPVLTALNGSSRLTGKGDLTVKISGPVAAAETVKRALDGEGKFSFRDGAVKGVNIPSLVRRAKSMLGVAGAQETGGPQQTDFSELSGTFRITDGLVANNDLRLLSPLLRVTGKGTFSIPTQEVNYRADSALVSDLSGQGGVLERKGLVIPVNIRGTPGNLSYTPDLEGLVLGNIGNVDQLGQTIKNLDTKEGQRATRNAIKDALGIPRQPDAAPPSTGGEEAAPPPPAAPKPEDLLKNLLGGR